MANAAVGGSGQISFGCCLEGLFSPCLSPFRIAFRSSSSFHSLVLCSLVSVVIKSAGSFLWIIGIKMSPYESCDFPNASSARICVSNVS